MANLNRPFGLRPVRHINGSPWSGEANLYFLPGGSTADIRIGDVVKQGSTADVSGIPSFAKYANGENGIEAPLGAVVGILPVGPRPTSLEGVSLSLEQKAILSGDANDRFVLVCDSQDVVYEAQADATGIARDAVGSNVDITATVATGNAISAAVVTSPGANTATFPYRLMGFSSKPTNEINAVAATIEPFIICLLQPNEHAFKVGKLARVV